MEENENKTELTELSEEEKLETKNEVKNELKNVFAWKWLIACGVLFVILIILAILVAVLRTGEVWPDVSSIVETTK